MKKPREPKFNLEDISTPLWLRISTPTVLEPLRSYKAFEVWRALGSEDRSFVPIAEAWNVSTGTIRNWATDWRWEDRARAFDAAVHMSTRKAIEAKIAEEAPLWLDRERKARSDSYDLAQALKVRVYEQLQHPTTRVTKETINEDGTLVVQIIEPNKWTDATMAKLIDTIRELEAFSIGIAPGSRLIDQVDMESLPLPVLEAIADGRPVDLRPYARKQFAPPAAEE